MNFTIQKLVISDSLVRYDLNLTLGCHRFYNFGPLPVLDAICLHFPILRTNLDFYVFITTIVSMSIPGRLLITESIIMEYHSSDVKRFENLNN
jgi:hypothetical protein